MQIESDLWEHRLVPRVSQQQRERRHRYEERDSESDSSSCHSPSPKRDPRDLKSKSRQNSLLEIDASDCYRDEERISDKDTATKEITRREGSSRRNRNDDFSLMNKR
ncbi:hypothetical protein QAD02_020333 [Eretmocerus hayati]|uniref:Uncharacterized protein n=1 Tax=Eretmocerus hayati TaxID=131215 RepID=A0ACC2PNE9_9HYME|nr:hypothetical protein QAD02_020333 [Eretmocerus hayati]